MFGGMAPVCCGTIWGIIRHVEALAPPPLCLTEGDVRMGATQRVRRTPQNRPIRKIRVQKVRATFHLSVDLLEELRDAAVALSGPPERFTLSALIEDGLRKELERLKKRYNGGRRFPHRASGLKGGRPIRP